MKNKIVTAILAFFFGIFGVHRFYLGQKPWGVLMFVASMFSIFLLVAPRNPVPFIILPAMIGFIDALLFLVMPQSDFDKKYNKQSIEERDPFDQPSYTSTGAFASEKEAIAWHRSKGIERYRFEDYEGAIDSFSQALGYNYRDPALHFNLACCHSMMEEADDAFHHLEDAFKYGFSEHEKLQVHPALAFLRIQPGFKSFLDSVDPASSPKAREDLLENLQKNTADPLLSQLELLESLREKEILTPEEYSQQRKKLLESRL